MKYHLPASYFSLLPWILIHRGFCFNQNPIFIKKKPVSGFWNDAHEGVNSENDTENDPETREKRIINPILMGLGLNARINPVTASTLTNGMFSTKDSLKKLEKYFPSAVAITDLPKILRKKMPSFSKRNTLLNLSLCPDEINYSFIKTLTDAYGPPFNLGGLGGIPFVGKSGINAATSHIPDSGKMFVVVAPHVGYSPSSDTLGKVKRPGRRQLSSACGAANGALSLIKKGHIKRVASGIEDFQEDYIIHQLESNQKNAQKNYDNPNDEAVWVAYEMYNIAKDVWKKIYKTNQFPAQDVAFLGGILINLGEEGDDLFQPISFSVSSEDLLTETFGGETKIQK